MQHNKEENNENQQKQIKIKELKGEPDLFSSSQRTKIEKEGPLRNIHRRM